jgi:hypothetical protein
MKKYRTWFFIVIAITLAPHVSMVIINCLGDFSSIFRKDYSSRFMGRPNKNFIKVRYITKYPNKHNCFVFGSSRVNGIDVRKMDGGNCYNMTYDEGLPGEHLDNLRYMLKKGVRIKTVLLGLDEFSYKAHQNSHLKGIGFYPYPPAINESVLPYYIKYPFHSFGYATYNRYLKNLVMPTKDKTVDEYDMFGTGIHFLRTAEESIEKHPDLHAKDVRFLRPELLLKGHNMEGALKDIKATVDLARANNIRLIIFINPIYLVTYLYADIDEFCMFRKELSKLTDYYDFSGLNPITTHNYYFYDSIHYRMKVGDLMLERMFNSGGAFDPLEFGVYVTADNVDAHIRRLRNEVKGITIPKDGF